MVSGHSRNLKNNDDIGKLSVPPGFFSLTSFELKKVENSEKTYDSNVVDVASAKRSIRHRPWIIHDESRFNEDDYSFQQFDKESDSFLLDDVPTDVFEDAPIFHPTEEEFSDAVKYIASIHSKAEPHGICRIVPPTSWKPPCMITETKIWKNSAFVAQAQKIPGHQNQSLDSPTTRSCENISTSSKKRKVLRSELEGSICINGSIDPDVETKLGPDFMLETFKEHADNFKTTFFGSRCTLDGPDVESYELKEQQEPIVENIEDACWKILQSHNEDIEVFYGDNLDTRVFGSGFPRELSSFEASDYEEYLKSAWNLNNVPKLPGSLLAFENSETASILVPRLLIGMCFSSSCWKVEEHNLYLLSYMHLGDPKVWHCVSERYTAKFEAAIRKQCPESIVEQDKLHHRLVTKLCPSVLKSNGIPVRRCVQKPGEFVVVFPGAYHSAYDCGFNCAEAVNFAPFDWLPYGEKSLGIYCEQGRKTSISYDKLLLGAAEQAVKVQWEITLLKKKTSDNVIWKSSCGKDGILTKAFKSRIRTEANRREYLCNSSQSRKMDKDFDSTSKKECFICRYDLHFSAACCPCSTHQYSCLIHAKQLCSCGWREKIFLFRYEINELNHLVDALEGKFSAVFKWCKDYLNLSFPSLTSSNATKSSNASLLSLGGKSNKT